MTWQWHRAARFGAGLVLAAVLVVALVPASRERVLRGAGWLLVSDDPLETADAIVLAVDAREAGVLEAADLVQQHTAALVALMAEPPDAAGRELVRRGVAYEDAATAAARSLKQLGVPAVERIPDGVDGTHTEAQVLRAWCLRRQLKSVIVVSTRDHSRRLRRVLRRTMGESGVRVVVRSSRFSTFDPDTWWRTRTGIRTQIIETEKLLLDFVGHPLS